MIFLICQRVSKTAKCQGKIREKSGNLEVDDKWQLWIIWFRKKRGKGGGGGETSYS